MEVIQEMQILVSSFVPKLHGLRATQDHPSVDTLLDCPGPGMVIAQDL